MLDLTFGEQVKIILSRKGMTIKELAETIEAQTGKKMSRQNLTQRLGRDNFQEQDMRMIAEILGCPFQLSILGESIPTERTHNNIEDRQERASAEAAPVAHERDITIGELVEIHEVLDALEGNAELPPEEEPVEEMPLAEAENAELPEADYSTSEYDASEHDALEYETSEYETSGYEESIEESVADHQEAGYEASTEELSTGEQEEVPRESSEQIAEEYPDEQQEEASDETSDETSEVISDETSVIEEEPEKKVRGWRAYLKRRKKKQEVPQSTVSQVEYEDDQQTESVTDEYPDGYTEDAADTGYAEEAYMQEGHADEEYVEYMDEEHTQEGYMQETQEEDYTSENDAEGDVQEAYGQEPEILEEEEDLVNGDVNPYTGREYQSNSVRMHPTRIGYVQVYDRSNHAWTDMTEWAFLGYQERKKMLLGKDYDPPIYLD